MSFNLLFQWLTSNSGTSRYGVCDIGEQQLSNWIWSDGIDPKQLKRIDIAVNYSMRRCASFDDANARKFCSEMFDVYGYQSNQEPNNSYSNPRNGHYIKIKVQAAEYAQSCGNSFINYPYPLHERSLEIKCKILNREYELKLNWICLRGGRFNPKET